MRHPPNQIQGYTYGLQGYMTNDTAHTYAYDAEGHVLSIDGGTTLKESYNALGWRVEAINCCGTVDYVHDAAGNMVGGSANGGPGTSTQYVYFRGGLLAQYWNGQGLWFAHLNGLGSTQQFTDYTGGNKRATMFYPFGQPGPSGSGSGSYLQALWSGFEDGDFWATSEWQTDTRRYTPGLGRWYTPDPAGKGAVHLDDPQTWNMYAYVRNNPTTLTDPSGLDSWWTRLEHDVAGYVSTALLAGARQWTAENLGQRIKNGLKGRGFMTDEQLLPKGTATSRIFFSANATAGPASQSVTYVPFSNKLYYSPAGALPLGGAGFSATAGVSTNADAYASGPSAGGCYFEGFGGCAGLSSSGDPAIQGGVGLGGWGFAGGYGVQDPVTTFLNDAYNSSPAGSAAPTFPAGGLAFDDPNMGIPGLH